ncbi:MAG TPA: hypothetical protein VEQ41_07330 [Solirubrobacterales bacterium]|nr:hypothetical protein [Solirubrobacterales bacterium]
MRRARFVLSLFVVLAVVAGCGEEGVAEDATLSVYVSQPLCDEARGALREAGSQAGDFRLRAVCVDDVGGSGDARLAAIGAAARRATEDSTAIAYVGTRDPIATRFSKPILEAAEIARVSTGSGSAAIARLRRAVAEVDDSDVRAAIASLL